MNSALTGPAKYRVHLEPSRCRREILPYAGKHLVNMRDALCGRLSARRPCAARVATSLVLVCMYEKDAW